ncbi:Elongator complex protein 2 [Liparis tanakae]|uniref:Elongator complex protein 2 n=1 Tax=Liparis tanakae TaxID=230148 RepID=A0A4Z2J843_9TELE|nr:Elongator complex protein 2 [Liparis tanakae]
MASAAGAAMPHPHHHPDGLLPGCTTPIGCFPGSHLVFMETEPPHTRKSRQSHALTVKRLRWRPRPGRAGHQNNAPDGQNDGGSDVEDENSWVQLASASADHSVKIFNVNTRTL